MNLADFIDSTYLKTPEQSGMSEAETKAAVYALADEAVANQLYAVMIRPEYVKEIKTYLNDKQSKVKVGTVIGFHEGTDSTEEKLAEARKAIEDGADDLDFVINYEAYKDGKEEVVKEEFLQCTELGIKNGKTVKWIIEIAALTDDQISAISASIAAWAGERFTEAEQREIFIKSSTGFYKTEEGQPNGATVHGITLMKASSGNLPIKAAGGVRSQKEAEEMIALGVTRIGTSSAAALMQGQQNLGGY